jgi:hypothetical protein
LEIRAVFAEIIRVIDRESGGGHSTRATSYRRWRVADRLGSQVVGQLLADRRSGMTKPALAARYAISLSSVKRMLK